MYVYICFNVHWFWGDLDTNYILVPLRIPDMWEGWQDKRDIVNCERKLVE